MKVNDSSYQSELFAMQYIKNVLLLPLIHNDGDGKQGTYDLLVKNDHDEPLIAVEVKRLIDNEYIKTASTIANREFRLKKGRFTGKEIKTRKKWLIQIKSDAYINKIDDKDSSLLPILNWMENRNISEHIVDMRNVKSKLSASFNSYLKSLSIISLGSFDPKDKSDEGQYLSFLPEGHNSHPALSSDGILSDVEDFISSKPTDYNSLVSKAKEENIDAHYFIIIMKEGMLSEMDIPSKKLSLPEGINGLWIVGLRNGLYWNRKECWKVIDKGMEDYSDFKDFNCY